MLSWFYEHIETSPGLVIFLVVGVPFIIRALINYRLLDEHGYEATTASQSIFFFWPNLKEVIPRFRWLAVISNLLAVYFLLGFLLLLWPVIKKSFQL